MSEEEKTGLGRICFAHKGLMLTLASAEKRKEKIYIHLCVKKQMCIYMYIYLLVGPK